MKEKKNTIFCRYDLGTISNSFGDQSLFGWSRVRLIKKQRVRIDKNFLEQTGKKLFGHKKC
jgi:hypothetical protein